MHSPSFNIIDVSAQSMHWVAKGPLQCLHEESQPIDPILTFFKYSYLMWDHEEEDSLRPLTSVKSA